MSVAVSQLPMTQEQFFDWPGHQSGRYEFDGFQPVAMTGGTIAHSLITRNILFALHRRLRGTGCEPLGPDAGVQTVGQAVRYPDAVISCTNTPGSAFLLQDPRIVFEVVSRTSSHLDRIVKLREYAAVPSILRYVILERTTIGLTVHTRAGGEDPWTTSSLAQGDVLAIPEVGIEVPVDEFYEGVEVKPGANR